MNSHNNHIEFNTKYRVRTLTSVHNKDGEFTIVIPDFNRIKRVPYIDMKLMENKKTSKRTVMIRLGSSNESAFWLNIYTPSTKTLASGKTAYYSWTKLEKKNRGYEAKFNKGYPDWNDGSILKWMLGFSNSIHEKFDKNSYALTAFGDTAYNKVGVPYIGIALSEHGNGNEFLLKIGSVVVSGVFEQYDGSFGTSSDSLCDCVGEFKIEE